MQRLVKSAIKMPKTMCLSQGHLSKCRPYATRTEPMLKKKRSNSKTPKKSKAALEDDIDMSQTLSAKKASPKPSPTMKTESAVQIGTNFEKRCIALLQEHFSMSLDRIAGPGDGGVDLAGWWWLPRIEGLPSVRVEPSDRATVKEELKETQETLSRIRILAQCKAEKIKVGPNYVREMEGVLHRLLHSQHSFPVESPGGKLPLSNNGPDPSPGPLKPVPTIAMLISLSRFTRGAIARAMSSPVPFILLHLPAESTNVEDTRENGSSDDVDQPSLQWNPVLGGENGLLAGKLEVRWERGNRTEQVGPCLWWEGQKLSHCVPD